MSTKIERSFPKITEQGMDELRERIGLKIGATAEPAIGKCTTFIIQFEHAVIKMHSRHKGIQRMYHQAYTCRKPGCLAAQKRNLQNLTHALR